MSEAGIPQKKPFVMKMEPGKYAWCSCGLSAGQPFCDGSHKGTEHRPVITEISEARNVAWCGCKKTAGAPFCDGAHSRLE